MGNKQRFNHVVIGRLLVRKERDGCARVRMFPTLAHSNFGDNVHGGATLGLIDVSLFAASFALGALDGGHGLTLDLSTQFIGLGKIDQPLDSVVELLRETGRLIFLRGLVVQADTTVAAFSGTIRKFTPKP